MGNRAKSDAKALRLAERRTKACELRIAGATYKQISDQLGYGSHANARKDIIRAIVEAGPIEEAHEVLRLELLRLDALLLTIWSQARRGSLPHWDRAMRNMERRAAYYGLDAAKKQTNTDIAVDFTTLTDEQIDQLCRGILPSSLAGRSGSGEAPPAEGPQPHPGGEEPPGDLGD